MREPDAGRDVTRSGGQPTVHPLADLSAYLDEALPAERREAILAHLAACDACRARLAELRETARLIAALPAPAASRSLVPRLRPPAWLAPLRTLATIASGASAFLFIASAILATGSGLGGGESAAEAQHGFAVATRAAPAAAAPASPAAALDAAKSGASASPSAPSAPSSPTTVARAAGEPQRPAIGPSPFAWLALAIVSGALALLAHRRLRTR